MIRCQDVSVVVRGVVALPPTSLNLADRDRVSLVGRNGSGKTTLVRVLAGLLEPTSGTVTGRPPRGEIVLVHQKPHLFHGTVHHNVALAAHLSGQRASAGEAALERLGVSHLSRRDVRVLSGGERRRVALARAFARGPSVLLLDEPFAELDPAARHVVEAALAQFTGTLVVTSPRGLDSGTDRAISLTPA